MWAVAVSFLQHGTRYDWHSRSYADDSGNPGPSLK